MRRLALPARLAHMVAEAARTGRQREAAELAVLLTERGLGGDSADLDRRLSRFRGREVAARERGAAVGREAGAESGGVLTLPSPRSRQAQETGRGTPASRPASFSPFTGEKVPAGG